MGKIYCNVSECSKWKKLDEPHERDYGLGHTPIGDMNVYKGECGLPPSWVQFDYVDTSTLNYKKKMIVCGDYRTEEDANASVNKIRKLLRKPDWDVTNLDGHCNARPCLYNDAETDSCMKWNETRYVDKRLARNGNESTELPICTSYSDREIKGHIDLTRFV